MYIFRSIQNYFAIAGINSLQSLRKHPFNAQNLTIFAMYLLSVALNIVYLVQIASDFAEYADVIYRLSTIFVCALAYAIHVQKMAKIFEIIDKFERIINASEWKFEVVKLLYWI